MRAKLPASLAGRLVVISAASVGIAIVVACLFMGLLLHRFVVGQIDQRLDAQAFAIAAALRASGETKGTAEAVLPPFDAPPFDRPHSGWTWRVEGPAGILTSSASTVRNLEMDMRPLDGPAPPRPPSLEPEGPPAHVDLHVRSFSVTLQGETLTIVVTAPTKAIYDPLRDVLMMFLLSMLGLGLALIVATFVQVRLGLLPLEKLRASLKDVRSGKLAFVPEDQPREVAPLASELNRLIRDGAESLLRARRHVANLAHGLKTPLAELAMTLREPGRDEDGSALALVEAMDQRIRHHLARARVSAISAAGRAATPVGSHVSDLVDVLSRLYAERSLRFAIAVPDGTLVGVESQDLDEMIGNLLDNACKWARSQVRVEASRRGPHIRILIEDDGPGLLSQDMLEALRPGRRLDEMTPGHGFGLPITRELAELYGGDLMIASSPLGGLAVSLDLPAPPN